MASKKCFLTQTELEEGEVLPENNLNEQYLQYYLHLFQSQFSQNEPLDLSIKKSGEEDNNHHADIDDDIESLSQQSSSEFSEDSAHLNSKKLACDICEKTFNKQSSLARHKYEHSGK